MNSSRNVKSQRVKTSLDDGEFKERIDEMNPLYLLVSQSLSLSYFFSFLHFPKTVSIESPSIPFDFASTLKVNRLER